MRNFSNKCPKPKVARANAALLEPQLAGAALAEPQLFAVALDVPPGCAVYSMCEDDSSSECLSDNDPGLALMFEHAFGVETEDELDVELDSLCENFCSEVGLGVGLYCAITGLPLSGGSRASVRSRGRLHGAVAYLCLIAIQDFVKVIRVRVGVISFYTILRFVTTRLGSAILHTSLMEGVGSYYDGFGGRGNVRWKSSKPALVASRQCCHRRHQQRFLLWRCRRRGRHQ